MLLHGVGAYGFNVTGPAGAGFVFGFGTEELLPAGPAKVPSPAFFRVEFTAEGTLRSFFPQHMVFKGT